jgi:hypothetical protein
MRKEYYSTALYTSVVRVLEPWDQRGNLAVVRWDRLLVAVYKCNTMASSVASCVVMLYAGSYRCCWFRIAAAALPAMGEESSRRMLVNH